MRRFLGITPELEELQPGHNVGVALLIITGLICGAAYIAAIAFGWRP